MSPTIRMERLDDGGRDRAVVSQLWRRSIEERSDEGPVVVPDAGLLPTARFMLVEDGGAGPVAMAGAVLPGAGARFLFEKLVSLPHPSLPTSDRTLLGEGVGLYVQPEWRRGGLAHVLTFLSLVLSWNAGARYLVAENGGVSLKMAQAAGFTATGVMTKVRAGVPYQLTYGPADVVLVAGYERAREALGQYSLDAELAGQLERWRASRPAEQG